MSDVSWCDQSKPVGEKMKQVVKICYYVLLTSLTYLKQNNVLVISY